MRYSKNGIKNSMFKPGQKVHYHPIKGEFVQRNENGIVKAVSNETNVWVVYYCMDDWKHYEEYCAQLTPTDHLSDGWLKESTLN